MATSGLLTLGEDGKSMLELSIVYSTPPFTYGCNLTLWPRCIWKAVVEVPCTLQRVVINLQRVVEDVGLLVYVYNAL